MSGISLVDPGLVLVALGPYAAAPSGLGAAIGDKTNECFRYSQDVPRIRCSNSDLEWQPSILHCTHATLLA